MRLGLAVVLADLGREAERRGVYRCGSGKRYGERRGKRSTRTKKRRRTRI